MSQGISHFPISQFLSRLLEETGHTRDGFVFALGYRNLKRGRRRLDAWMDRGEGDNLVLDQIAAAFPVIAADLRKAFAATVEIKAAEAYAEFLERCKEEAGTFVAFLNADGDVTVPSSIVLFGMTGGHQRWTRIEIPREAAALPVEQQIEKLPPLMLDYKERFRGFVPFHNRLQGFKLVRLLDYFQFDVEGRFVRHVGKPFRHGTAEVSLR